MLDTRVKCDSATTPAEIQSTAAKFVKCEVTSSVMGEIGCIKGGTGMLYQLDHLFLVGPGHERVQGVVYSHIHNYKIHSPCKSIDSSNRARPLEGSYMVYNTLGTCLSPRSSQESV